MRSHVLGKRQDPQWDFEGYSSWPRPVFDALRQVGVLDQQLAGRYEYRLTAAGQRC